MPLLQVDRISRQFPIEGGVFRRRVGSVAAVREVSFSLARGETVGLVGGSGSGKSTIAKMIAGLMDPDAGTMTWEGQPLGLFTRQERARRIQMIFQDPFASLNSKLSVGTILREALAVCGGSPREAAELLEAVQLHPDALNHYPFQFSGGQRQRIGIARALALRPDLLIADEPLSALDLTIQAQILNLFQELRDRYRLTFLMITHDLAVVDQFCNRVLVLENGALVEEGPTAEVLSRPKHTYTQRLLDAVPRVAYA